MCSGLWSGPKGQLDGGTGQEFPGALDWSSIGGSLLKVPMK